MRAMRKDQGLRQGHSHAPVPVRERETMGWWDQRCEKRKHEAEDCESELEAACVSRNLVDLFDHLGQAEPTAASSVREDASEDKQERAEQTGAGETSNRAKPLQEVNNLERATQDTIIFMHSLSKLKPPLLIPTDVKPKEWLEDCRALRSSVSNLKEQRSTIPGARTCSRWRSANCGVRAQKNTTSVLPWQG